MKPRQILFFLLCLPFCLFAQSKRIGFLSHSGRAANFETALAHESLFGTAASDFGEAPDPFIRNVHLDSLIALDEHRIVMVSSGTCTNIYDKDRAPHAWSPGRDTIIDHPDFGNIHQLNMAKNILQNQYYFDHTQPTVFVGYDNQQTPSKDRGPISAQQQPIPEEPQQQPMQYDPQQMPEQTQDSAQHNQLNAIPFNTGGPSDKTGAVALWLMVALLVSLSVGVVSFLRGKCVVYSV
jgi:hypothetical protein